MWTRFLRQCFFRAAFNPLFCRWLDFFRPTENLGQRGELLAERYLLKSGYVIVGRNFRVTRGEIDLIAVDRESVVFVEVKTRASKAKGVAAEAVDDEKQKRISRAAAEYSTRHRLTNSSRRFDVIAIDFDGNRPQLRHFTHAFEYALDD